MTSSFEPGGRPNESSPLWQLDYLERVLRGDPEAVDRNRALTETILAGLRARIDSQHRALEALLNRWRQEAGRLHAQAALAGARRMRGAGAFEDQARWYEGRIEELERALGGEGDG